MKRKNPVARCARRYNKSAKMRDRTKYFRKEKHKGHDAPYFMDEDSTLSSQS